MRRFLIDLGRYAAGLGPGLARAWDSFFFRAADPTPLALVRIVVGLLLLWSLAVGGAFDLRAFFGSDGWVDPEVARQVLAEQGGWGWSLWLHVPDAWLFPAWLGCLVVLTMFTLGLFSRTTAVLAWMIAVSTARRTPVLLFGFDQIVSTWALYLAATFSSGQALSVDRFFARLRPALAEARRQRKEGANHVAPRWSALGSGVPAPSVGANLALRLIQLHLTLIYVSAGLAKLRGEPWWNGQAAWGLISAAEFRLFDLSWMAAYPRLIEAATHAGLLLELGLPILLWIKPLRPLGLAVALVMHASIGLMLGLTTFSLAMIAGCLAFASGPWLRSLIAGDWPADSGKVLYDGRCPRCRSTMAVALAADLDRSFDPIDFNAVADLRTIHPALTREACTAAMQWVGPDGKVRGGYDAVRAMARRLPLTCPLAVLGGLPGVAWAGRLVYNRIASTRRRDGDCTDETCGLHGPQTQEAAQTAGPGRRP
ncbi:DCC1-like thiol-disulfide oxidoreductase family protein [Isosphaeraceae bacterium EP7]